MDKPVRVRLSDDQLLDKSRSLGRKYSLLKALKRELKDATATKRKAIRETELELDALHEEINTGFEERPQGDLFAQAEAQKALHDVAAVAGEGAAPLPSEPHEFKASRLATKGDTPPDECQVCGSTASDPVHAMAEAGEGTVDIDGVPETPDNGARAHARKRPRGPLARANRRGRKEARA
jgi:hypothetical protein